tara:strand:+ start:4756 stop:4935 length:180 start_codon:yes stop_codon:yes gene_type:complete
MSKNDFIGLWFLICTVAGNLCWMVGSSNDLEVLRLIGLSSAVIGAVFLLVWLWREVRRT